MAGMQQLSLRQKESEGSPLSLGDVDPLRMLRS
jgi:hypothetical protein